MNSLIQQYQRCLLFIGLMLVAHFSHAQTASLPEVEAARVQAIAEEAYIYGLPLVMTYGVMYAFSLDPTSSQYKGPMNQLNCSATLYTPADKEVPFANNDTLYCIGWLDLRTEPMVITVPAVEKARYRSVMLTDMSSVNYGLIGTRTTGNGAGDFLIVGPDWQGLPMLVMDKDRAPGDAIIVGDYAILQDIRAIGRALASRHGGAGPHP